MSILNPNAILWFVLSKAELVGLDLVIKNFYLLKDFGIYFNNHFLAKIMTFRQFLFGNPSIGSKVMNRLSLGQNTWQKITIFNPFDVFYDVTLIFNDRIG